MILTFFHVSIKLVLRIFLFKSTAHLKSYYYYPEIKLNSLYLLYLMPRQKCLAVLILVFFFSRLNVDDNIAGFLVF